MYIHVVFVTGIENLDYSLDNFNNGNKILNMMKSENSPELVRNVFVDST